jgi:two-component SAPR family response regulator
VIGLIVFVVLRKKSPKHNIEKVVNNEEIQNISHSKAEKIEKSAIYLFGGFQVYDKEGTDITGLFTPTLKQLFIAILLSAVKNDKGISSHKLTEFLWPDKTDNSARNNRNVSISKLRLLLDRIGPIEINNESTYWKIIIDDTIFCDYSFVNNSLRESVNSTITTKNIYKLLSIVSKGDILPDIQTDWIDDFKADLTNLLIDVLIQIARNQDDLQLLALIGNTALKYAPLNEDAISIKCKALFKLGKKGASKQSYDRFCKEYLEVLDVKYDKSFQEIIS